MTFEHVLKANGFIFDRSIGPLDFFRFHLIRAAIAASPVHGPHLSVAAYAHGHSCAKIVGHWTDPMMAALELPNLLATLLKPAEASENEQYLAS